MKKHIIKIEISTRKGQTQITQWEVWQDRVFPCIKGHSSSGLDWSNTEGLFSQYGQGAQGLRKEYTAVLLKDNYTSESAQGNRKDYAGYDGNGGTITLRGSDLGEIGAKIRPETAHCHSWISYSVRGYDDPTQGEKNFLQKQVTPALLDYVKRHEKSLKTEAVRNIKAHFKSELAQAQQALERMQEKAKNATY